MAEANVRVLVSAITEAAEQSLEDVGDEMASIQAEGHLAAEGLDAAGDEMSSTTRTAVILQAALDELGDESLSTAAQAEVLQSVLDEVGDEATQAAAKSAAASGAFSTLSVSSSGAAVSVGTLSTAFTLSLIPAVLTAATVLAPVVVMLGAIAAAAVAVAGAFGLIIGSGILAWGDQMSKQNQEELDQTNRLIKQYERMRETQGQLTAQQEDRLKQLRQKKKELEDQTSATGALASVVGDLKEEIAPLIVEFGKEFIPLIREGVQAIPDVVEEMLNAVGGTEEFKNALRDFGMLAADVLPMLTGLMFDLARMALPVLRDLIGFLEQNGQSAMDSMAASVEELWPEFMELLDALIDLAPTLLEFGTNVGEVLIPALTELTGIIDGTMEFINDLDETTQDLVITMLLLAPAIVKVVSALEALAGSATVAKLGELAGMVSLTTAGAVALGAALGVIGVKLLDMLGVFDIVRGAGEALAGLFGQDIADAFLTISTILSGGALPLIAALGAAIIELVQGDLGGAIDKIMQIIDIFGSAFANTFGNVISMFEDAVGVVDDILSTLEDIAGQTFDTILDIVMQLTDPITGAPGPLESDIQSLLAKGDPRNWGGGGPGMVEQARQARQAQNVTNQNRTEVNVDVGGDLQQNPWGFSRNLADQVTREQRQNNGT